MITNHDKGLVIEAFGVDSIRMIYGNKMWHIQYKNKNKSIFWKTYCTYANYDEAVKIFKALEDSGIITIHRYSNKTAMEIILR